MTLSIIMINYNAPAVTEQAINSIVQFSPKISFEIILVENGTQRIQKEFLHLSNLKVFQTENKGFSHACNFGAEEAQGEYLLFLNNDTIMQKDTLEKSIFRFQQEKNTGVLGVRILNPDGTLDHGCKRGFPTPLASFCYFTKLDKIFPNSSLCGAYRQTTLREDTVGDVDAVSGCYLMIRQALFAEIGGFDETFFMYGEDLDLCYRIKKAGYRIFYYGEVFILHLKGESGLHKGSEKVIRAFYESMGIFYRKHYQNKYSWFINKLVLTAIKAKEKIALHSLKK